ncbi:MAG: TerB family tellurite resistance protein [Alphaproteobacteria bacterium]|nr:TerB family tellurite resistance protein [Alphaproteobacteria bacterium]
MFMQLMNFLKAPETQRPADLRVAVAVLLLEAAYRDDTFSGDERSVIARLLRQRFGLSDSEASQLMAAAESRVRQMVQRQPFTHAVSEQMPPAERIGVIEMLWEVAYADGVLDPEEDAMIRKVAGLIYVEDRDRMLARQRVLARMKG